MTIRNAFYTYCPAFLHQYWDRVERSKLANRLVKGVFWTLAGAVISRGIMLLASIFVAHMLGSQVYGELGIVRSTVLVVGVFAGFSLGLMATKLVAEFRNSDPARAGRIIALSGLVASLAGALGALILFAFAPWLAEHTLNAPYLSGLLRIGGLLLLLEVIYGTQVGALAGLEAFKTIARVNLLVGLASFPILVAGTYFGGLQGAVWALVLNLAVSAVLNHLALRKKARQAGVPITFRGCRSEWTMLRSFGIPATMNACLFGLGTWLCAAILVNQPQGYAEIGVFNAAHQWYMVLLFLPGVVTQVTLPMLADIHASWDRSGYVKLVKYSVLINAGVALATAVPIACLSPLIMAMYGSGFEERVWILVPLSIGAVVVSVDRAIGRVIISQGRMWLMFSINVFWGAMLVVSTLVFIERGLGAFGLAWAYVIASVAQLLARIYCVSRIIANSGVRPSTNLEYRICQVEGSLRP